MDKTGLKISSNQGFINSFRSAHGTKKLDSKYFYILNFILTIGKHYISYCKRNKILFPFVIHLHVIEDENIYMQRQSVRTRHFSRKMTVLISTLQAMKLYTMSVEM